MRKFAALVLGFALLALHMQPVAAQNAPAPPLAASPPAGDGSANDVIAKMLERNAGLRTYRTRVHLKAHMLNFPFLSQKLQGTSYFSAPTTYEVVFDRVPSYAKGFSRVLNDVGDPAHWSKDNNITLDGRETVNGNSLIVLRLTKKIHSTQLDHALAFVDPQTYELVQMEWDYTSGGKVVMTQRFRNENGFDVLASQHAVINIPYFHIIADASYEQYETNVAIELPPPPG